MKIRLQRYNFKLEYTPGEQLYTDPTEKATFEIQDDIEAYVNMVTSHVPALPTGMKQIITETQKDGDLQALIQVIQDGWPEEVRECSKQTREYWNSRAELTTVDGIIYKGMEILIPKTMRKMMTTKIHEGHLDMEKFKQRARSVLY